jgi:hypothetical protein
VHSLDAGAPASVRNRICGKPSHRPRAVERAAEVSARRSRTGDADRFGSWIRAIMCNASVTPK